MESLDLQDKKNYSFIDPELRALIHELNKIGLKTRWSCSGNHGEDSSDSPYITFDVRKIKDFHFLFHKNTLSIYWER